VGVGVAVAIAIAVAIAVAVAGAGAGAGAGSGRPPGHAPGIRVAANPVTARYFSPLFPPDSIASESGPNTINTQALQRMQASSHRPRKRYRVSRPEMI